MTPMEMQELKKQAQELETLGFVRPSTIHIKEGRNTKTLYRL